jgi:hypothetical protein
MILSYGTQKLADVRVYLGRATSNYGLCLLVVRSWSRGRLFRQALRHFYARQADGSRRSLEVHQ